MKVFAENRKAKNSYEFLEFFEAGIVLSGPETKSIRIGGISIIDAFAIIENEEAKAMVDKFSKIILLKFDIVALNSLKLKSLRKNKKM